MKQTMRQRTHVQRLLTPETLPELPRPRTGEGVVRVPQSAAHKAPVNRGENFLLVAFVALNVLTFGPKTSSGSSFSAF